MTVTIYQTDGIHPASGVTVKFYEVSSKDFKPVSVYVTNCNGQFSIENLHTGIYRCWIETDSFALFQDSVMVGSSQSTLRDDTLELTSTISGVVSIEPLKKPFYVNVWVLGTGKMITVTGEDGWFTIKGLVGGTFTLLIKNELSGYTSCLKEITVTSGSNDTIYDTLKLFSNGIPAASDILIMEDTLNEKITISWDKSLYPDLLDYVIFRENCNDINIVKTAYHVTTDTFFMDDLSSNSFDRNDINQADFYKIPGINEYPVIDTFVQCLKYWVALRSNERKIGPVLQCVQINAASKEYVKTYFAHNVVHIDGKTNFASINDSVIFRVQAKNATRPLRRLIWFDPVTEDTINKKIFDDTLKKEITDSLLYSFEKEGNSKLCAILIDYANTEWRDTIPIEIVLDIPEANAGNDTGVLAGEKVILHGSADQLFGKINKWQWKIGSEGKWMETSGSDTFFVPQSLEPMTVCSLAVTDDDGYRGVDEVLVFASQKVQSVAAGASHSLVKCIDSTVWSFGLNKYGQLGDGTGVSQYYPVQLTSNVKSMAAGTGFSLILRNDGTLLGCGYNRNGQLGDGSEESCTFLIQVATNVQQIAAGSYHSMILKNDGTLWTSGRNIYGQLGDSTYVNRIERVKVMEDVQNMAGGLFHSMILKTDGSLWTCGCDSLGQLGDSTSGNRSWPVKILNSVIAIATGENHNLIIKTDGSLWAWGDNYYGQLGDGTNINRFLPVQIMNDVKSIATGASHSLILKNDGTLFSCGHNGYGQLGDGTTNFHSRPKQIMTNVQSIAAGMHHTLINKTDGSLWVCGSNSNGELGNEYLGLGAKNIQAAPRQTIPFRVYSPEELIP